MSESVQPIANSTATNVRREDHDQLVKSYQDDLTYSVQQFDNYSMAISSGALIFTLSFIKDIVPLEKSIERWSLYSSIVLFLIGVILSYGGQIFSLILFVNKIDRANAKYDYRIGREGILMRGWNILIAISVIVGLGLLAFFCIWNIDHVQPHSEISI